MDDNGDDVFVAISCLEAADSALSYLFHVHFQRVNHHEARLVEGKVVTG